MSRGFSIYLNALRFGAAMIVLLSHFAYSRFSDGAWIWVRELNLGSDAVVVFFVLSGLVIALTADTKDRELRDFAVARSSRILSVALPALIIGWGLDRIGSDLAPAQYQQPYFNPLPLWETLLRGVSFSNEWNGTAIRLGSNGPFWSLSYEVAYYAMFGIAWYLTGVRRVMLLCAVAILVGPNIMLLMPAWLMGVWLYHRLKTAAAARVATAIVLTGVPIAIYILALRFEVPDILRTHLQPSFPNHDLRFSDEYLWNALLGLLVTFHLIGMATLSREWTAARPARLITWCAGASFSIYLVHYPVLQVLHAGLPGLGHGGLFALTLLVCFLFAEVFERPLHLWRRLLRDGTTRRSTGLAG
jgi:peptidoglycan/LPS O-acetylase OafA/YrhL